MLRLTFVVFAIGAAACARTSAPPPQSPAPGTRPPAPSVSWEDSVLATLSLRERAAQMVWPSIQGNYVGRNTAEWAALERLVREEKVGGFSIFFGSPTEIADKLNTLQAMSAVPLLVGSDVEFGVGHIVRGGYIRPELSLGGATLFPTQMALGAAGDTALAYEQGRVTAREGRAVGIHMAYAPILDVNINPANPVINTRSYAGDPKLAARLGASFVRGLQEHGMIATGKHFPGHGDTETNSHLALPSVNVSRARLDSVELVPFRAAVAAGLGAMMTFHGAMPALDSSGVPGTLSERVLTGLLREEMGFGGLVVSDAMDMRGVLDRYGMVDATKRAVAAGADILIQPVSVAGTIDAIVAGVTEGRYPQSRVDDAARRILAAKRRLGLDRARLVSLDSLRDAVGDSTHAASARRAAERSITLVKDSLGVVPLRADTGLRVLSITFARRADIPAGLTFDGELRRRYRRLRAEWVNADEAVPSFARALALADSVDAVIVSSYVSHAWNASTVSAPQAFAGFVRTLVSRGKRPVFVALGNPYALQQVPQVPAYLVAWGGTPVSQAAAARALMGLAPITGTLPTAIPPLAPVGAGLRRTGPAAP